ncbi:nucleoside triphosphate pyrophosphohydrolase [Mangrovibacillus cuniculi]|uniref:Nucleoside triphosphate pyrophosphohydrolase n=1 Tax=Mangrovibacillus cuniculi TaxID=2593652 RepID=A0A7S8CDU8_9BACI|nr:nucleoside triphosphate pyrophosphohydrolase [Mangrovibacillus cuniculi]QPC47983.1 nucleoside triphosphate pyrophosphohydrolase [Mangrovibacillus cuniculi]
MNTISIIGLGAGSLDQLSLRLYKKLTSATTLRLRTKEHPIVRELEQDGVTYESFDDIYERFDNFLDVYQTIAKNLVEESKNKEVTYAVPGHPMVAEMTVQLLIESEKRGECSLRIEGGQSFLDDMLTAVRVDPIEGFALLDGTNMQMDSINTAQHLFIAQVYDQFVLSDVKLTLMNWYPDDHLITVIEGAGGEEENVYTRALFEIDHDMLLNNLRSIYIPPLASENEFVYRQFSKAKQVIAALRGPGGCPWDQEQTHESLKKYLIEESYELLDAIDRDDIDDIISELGDVLLQVLLHAQIGEDDGMFAIEDVIESLNEKMIRRHPHVFGDKEAESTEDVMKQWQQIKAEERGEAPQKLLDDVEANFPALMKAYKYQKKASKVGFDWDNAELAFDKVKEELLEFENELQAGNQLNREKEFGDLLFSIVNVGRLLSIYPEDALRMTNEKFYHRFSYVEAKLMENKKQWEDVDLAQLELWWKDAKKGGDIL